MRLWQTTLSLISASLTGSPLLTFSANSSSSSVLGLTCSPSSPQAAWGSFSMSSRAEQTTEFRLHASSFDWVDPELNKKGAFLHAWKTWLQVDGQTPCLNPVAWLGLPILTKSPSHSMHTKAFSRRLHSSGNVSCVFSTSSVILVSFSYSSFTRSKFRSWQHVRSATARQGVISLKAFCTWLPYSQPLKVESTVSL